LAYGRELTTSCKIPERATNVIPFDIAHEEHILKAVAKYNRAIVVVGHDVKSFHAVYGTLSKFRLLFELQK
jgi:hypothetical protein